MMNRLIIFLLHIFFTFFSHSPVWGSTFKLVPDGHIYRDLKKEDQKKIEEFLREVESLVPPKMRNVINGPVMLKWKKLDSHPQLLPPPCPASSVVPEGPESPESPEKTFKSITPPIYGQLTYPISLFPSKKLQSPRIHLHSHFIAPILKGEKDIKQFPCSHKNDYRHALASVLHELTHHYHNLLRNSGSATFKAEERQLKHLTGWIKNDLFRLKRSQGNILHHRSPDLYEYKDPAESFAVNMEYFLLDPEFVCRRPALGKFFIKHLEYEPFPQRPCQIPLGLHLDTELGPTLDKLSVDPQRVFGIHYLHADTGKSMISKWGHAMIRIILCAPERPKVGPECLQDVNHHLVVSFRAQMKKSPLSSLYGLTGHFPNKAFILPFLKVHDEYTLYGGRNLISLPLQLSPEEKEIFIYRLIEQQNEYLSKYYFLSNNCATEADALLKAAIPKVELQKILPRTPLGLMEDLIELGLATDLKEINRDDPMKATREGYFFPSNKDQLRKSFNAITELAQLAINSRSSKDRRKKKNWKHHSLEDFLEKLSPAKRREAYEEIAAELTDPVLRKKLAGHFFLLESFVYQKMEFALKKKMSAMVLNLLQKSPPKSCSSGDMQKLREILEQTKKIQESFHLSAQQTKGGYGLILPQDLPEPILMNCPLSYEEAGEQLSALYLDTMSIMKHMNPADSVLMEESQLSFEHYYSRALQEHE